MIEIKKDKIIADGLEKNIENIGTRPCYNSDNRSVRVCKRARRQSSFKGGCQL